MSSSLRLDWCSHEAAKYAVEHWHYSGTMPVGKLVRVGVWEEGRFIGVVIFGRGAIYRIGDPFGLPQTEVCELVRVALRGHSVPVSRIGSLSVRMLKRHCPGLRLIVSYADPKEGHAGIIYQAMNWVYTGTQSAAWKMVNGEVVHPRSLYSRYGTHALSYLRTHVDPHSKLVRMPGKHKYLYPLDPEVRTRIAPLARPYPKRPCVGSIVADAPAVQAGEGGSTPTPTLHEVVA
jgi:hypothetical protein